MDHNKRFEKYNQVKPASRAPQKGADSNVPQSIAEPATHSKPKHRPFRTIKHKTIATLNKVNLSKRSKIVIGSFLVVIIACIVVGLVTSGASGEESRKNNRGQILENLEYQTVLPAEKSITDLGGWKRVSPPDGDPVYAYTDTLSGVAISVSQQPLPESSQGNTSQALADIAKNLNATTKLSGTDTEAYVGTNSKGPQSVVFTKNYLLILIKSQDKISDASWAQYIKTLR